MAKSYSQIEGFDYQQTFSPVAKQTIVRVFEYCRCTRMVFTQLDVNNAFLHGDFEGKPYIEILPGYLM